MDRLTAETSQPCAVCGRERNVREYALTVREKDGGLRTAATLFLCPHHGKLLEEKLEIMLPQITEG